MTDTPDASQPGTSTSTSTTNPQVEDDQGAALERSAESISEARDAEGSVAANEDITTRDDERAGEHSEDPDGSGGHP